MVSKKTLSLTYSKYLRTNNVSNSGKIGPDLEAFSITVKELSLSQLMEKIT